MNNAPARPWAVCQADASGGVAVDRHTSYADAMRQLRGIVHHWRLYRGTAPRDSARTEQTDFPAYTLIERVSVASRSVPRVAGKVWIEWEHGR